MEKTTKRKYSDALRATVVESFWENGKSLSRTGAQFGVPRNTLRRWLAQIKVPETIEDIPNSIFASSALRFRQSVGDGSGYTERQLQFALAENCVALMQGLGLPPCAKVLVEYPIALGCRVDLFVEHTDGSISLAEVKAVFGYKGRGWLFYPAVGQLLYYMEVLQDQLGDACPKVNLLFLADYDTDAHLMRVLNRTLPPIQFLNVMPLLSNVSPSKIH